VLLLFAAPGRALKVEFFEVNTRPRQRAALFVHAFAFGTFAFGRRARFDRTRAAGRTVCDVQSSSCRF